MESPTPKGPNGPKETLPLRGTSVLPSKSNRQRPASQNESTGGPWHHAGIPSPAGGGSGTTSTKSRQSTILLASTYTATLQPLISKSGYTGSGKSTMTKPRTSYSRSRQNTSETTTPSKASPTGSRQTPLHFRVHHLSAATVTTAVGLCAPRTTTVTAANRRIP